MSYIDVAGNILNGKKNVEKDNELTPESFEMYNLLKDVINIIADSKYGGHFILKGGSSLLTKLIETNNLQLWRATTDIDLQVDSIAVWNSFKEDIVTILNSGSSNKTFRLLKSRSRPTETSDSITLGVMVEGTLLQFKIDTNVAKDYEVSAISFNTINLPAYDEYTSMADKLMVLTGGKIYRRVKDIYDLYVYTSIHDFCSTQLLATIDKRYPDFFRSAQNMLIPENIPSAEHAYNKFEGIRQKPEFGILVDRYTSFVEY